MMKRYIVSFFIFLFCIHSHCQDVDLQNVLTRINDYVNAGQINNAEIVFNQNRELMDSMTGDIYFSIINLAKYSKQINIDNDSTSSTIMRIINGFAENRDVVESNPGIILYFQAYIAYFCQTNNCLYRNAYNTFKQLWPNIVNDYSQVYTNILEIVSIQDFKNDYNNEAIQIFEEILELNRRGYQFSVKPYYHTGLIGYSYFKQKQYDKAVSYLDQALAMVSTKDKTETQDDYYNVMQYRFDVAVKLSQIEKSRELGKKLIKYYENKNDKIQSLINVSIGLADLEFSAFNYDEGISLYEMSMKYILSSGNYDQNAKKHFLTNLYTIYDTRNVKESNRKYQVEKKIYNIKSSKIERELVTDQYIDSLLKSVSFQQSNVITDIRQYTRDIQVIARYYSSNEMEQVAIDYLEKTINDLRNNNEIEQNYARLYNTLGSIYSHLQNIDKAKENHHKAQIIYNTNGILDTEYIDILCNISNDYRSSNDFLLAKIYLDEAFNVSQSLSGFTEEKDTYYNLLSNLSMLYKYLGNKEKALLYNQMIIEDVKTNTKFLDLKKSAQLSRVSILLFFDQIQEARSIIDEIGSKYIEDTNSWWAPFEVKYWSNDSSCEQDLYRMCQNERRKIAQLYTTISNNNLKGYWEVTGTNLNSDYSMALCKFNTPSLRTATYNNLLFTKNFQLEISKLQRKGTNRKLTEEDVLKLNNSISNTEGIKEDLDNNDVAIEYFILEKRNTYLNAEKKYGALVLHKDQNAPVFVELCDLDSLGNIVYANTLGEATEYARKYYDLSNTEIYDLIWKPLEKELKGKTNIYISGSGATLFVNLSALSNGKKRLGEIYHIHNVFSTSMIKSTKNFDNYNTAAVYGGIDYNTSLDVMADEASNYFSHSETVDLALFRGIGERGAWGNLKFSLVEADNIEKILKDKKLSVSKFVKNKASEESFKALSGISPDIIHISTHGYYYQPYIHDFRSDYSNAYFAHEENNNLKYNGLLFSGANNAWRNNQYKENVDDGILTAEEISLLDLSNTKLVALSACQTGLGEVHDVDGNNGLLRAFKIAGVKDVIITLWNVSDNASSVFMESFYQNLSKGNGVKSALDETIEQAKKTMPDSYYWAPFVLIE